MWYSSLAAMAVSAATGVASSIQSSRNAAAQAKAQSNQAQYQAKIAEQNQQLAQEQASAQRRTAYEEQLNTRRKAAALIGSQRAAAGASGMVTDYGSFADVADDAAMRAEIDAVNAYNKGMDTAYNTEIQAWNYGSQATGYEAQADAYRSQIGAARSAGLYGAIGSAAGGIASIGSTWAGYAAKAPPGGGGDKGINGLTASDFFNDILNDYPDFA